MFLGANQYDEHIKILLLTLGLLSRLYFFLYFKCFTGVNNIYDGTGSSSF